MREIKFRVWDTKSESMEYEIAIGKGYGEDSYILFLGLGETFIIDEDIVKIMQYTGLKDKNGVEIYEGDIIKDSSGRIMIVEWDNRIGTARYIFRAINTIGHIKTGRLINTHDWITSDENDIETIGNIYENPELLELE